jgi:hypothetical protein
LDAFSLILKPDPTSVSAPNIEKVKRKDAIMKSKMFLAAAVACALTATTAFAQTIDTRIGKLDFELGVPTQQTAAKLYDEMDFQRAVQCYLWGVTIVNVEQNRQGLVHGTGAKSGDLALYDDYRSKSTILGANNSTPYIYGFIDLSEKGPMVVDYPPGPSAGAVMDWWERPLTDVGLPGADQGKGLKYLLVGPGQETPKGAEGYRVVRSRMFKTEFFFRTLDTDPAKAKAFVDAVHIYPWSERDKNPPRTRMLTPKADGALLNQSIPRVMAYWERLSQSLAGEPGEDRDRFFMAMLKSLGIETGKPFAPDARQKKILEEAATVGEAMAKSIYFRGRFPDIRYRPDAKWEFMIPPWFNPQQDVKNSTQFDERTDMYYAAWGMSDGSITTTRGVGQTYLASFVDKEGQSFDGAKSYRLRVPPNPPAKLFWSVTLYEVDTRVLIQNAAQKPDRVSTDGLDTNADGSVDIYLSPTAPKGHEKNWIQTVPGRAWYTLLRLYGPLEPYYERSWALPDIEKVN